MFPGALLVALCDRARRAHAPQSIERCRWGSLRASLAPAEAAGNLDAIKLSDRKAEPWPGSS